MPVFECKACQGGNDPTECHVFVEYPDGSISNPRFCPWGGEIKAVWYRLGVTR
jgi:hypothetical protein